MVRMVSNTVMKSKYVGRDSTFYYTNKYSWEEKRSAFALKHLFSRYVLFELIKVIAFPCKPVLSWYTLTLFT